MRSYSGDARDVTAPLEDNRTARKLATQKRERLPENIGLQFLKVHPSKAAGAKDAPLECNRVNRYKLFVVLVIATT